MQFTNKLTIYYCLLNINMLTIVIITTITKEDRQFSSHTHPHTLTHPPVHTYTPSPPPPYTPTSTPQQYIPGNELLRTRPRQPPG